MRALVDPRFLSESEGPDPKDSMGDCRRGTFVLGQHNFENAGIPHLGQRIELGFSLNIETTHQLLYVC